MARWATCGACHAPIQERGNEVPYGGKMYHRSCYDQMSAKQEEVPSYEELQRQLDGARQAKTW